MESLGALRKSLIVLAGAALPLCFAAGSRATESPSPARPPATLLVRFANPATAAAKVKAARDTPVGRVTSTVELVKIQPGEALSAKLAEYNGRSDVVYAEPNYVVHAATLGDPDDPRFPDQWGLSAINALGGWGLYPGAYGLGGGPKIAVLDTGVDAAHEDLAANVDLADAANCVGGTCTAGSSGDDNPEGHGTHVSGIAAAVTNNGTGVAGVAFSSPIIPVKVLNSSASGSYAAVAAGITWAVNHGAKVINLSLGGTSSSSTLCSAISNALSHGVVVVAAAGNNNSASKFFPAACPGVVGVGATTEAGGKAGFSNFGFPDVFVSAPGDNIVSTLPGDAYGELDGTSMSSPFVAGLAALLIGQHPERTPSDVKRVLARTPQKLGGAATYAGDPFHTCSTCTWRTTFGYGEIDVLGALLGPTPLVSSFSPGVGPVGTTVTVNGQDLTGATEVQFGSKSQPSLTIVNSSKITAAVPAGATNGVVRVLTSGGTGTSTGVFLPTPTFAPASGQSSDEITISGPKLDDATAVTFNGIPATTWTVDSESQITATVPEAATTGKIVVTTPSGVYATATSFVVKARITSFAPTSGTTGTVVTITGTNFNGVTSVKFNGVSAGFTRLSATSVKATVPTTATTGKITLTIGAGTATSPDDFAVLPKVTSFSPANGPVGTQVTVKGSGFRGTPDVRFNGTSSLPLVTNVTSTSLKAVVPAGATTGQITVETADGPVTSVASYKVTPKITGFTPSSGAVGDTISVTGTNLNDLGAALKLGSVAVTIIPDSSTHVSFVIPATAVTGKLNIKTNDGSYTTSGSLTVLPKILSFDPTSRQTGRVVTIAGTTFGGATSVKFNGVSAGFRVLNPTTISATVPTTATTGKIAVTTAAGTSTSSDDFVVLPKVTSFSPSNGPVGTQVTVNGSGFRGTPDVRFNDASSGAVSSASVTNVSATSLKAVVPGGATTGQITVETADGSISSTASYKVTPKITGFTSQGAVGDTITVTGTNLDDPVAALKLGSVAVTLIPDSSTQVSFVIPANAVTGKLTFSTSYGSYTTSGSVKVVPAVLSFDPASGQVGSVVTITGTTFTGTSSVKFNGVSSGFTVVNPTTIKATVPTTAGTGPITVTTAAGTATSADEFGVLPKVLSFTPLSGPTGTQVTVSGSGFRGLSDVMFNDMSASAFTLVSALQIKATVPAGATTGPITIVTDVGSETSVNNFVVRLSLDSISPSSGAPGSHVTIAGHGFTPTSVVKFNGLTAVRTVISDTEIDATVPPNATSGPVTVTTVAGTATCAEPFLVSPAITGFTPSLGPVGTEVAITGRNFEDAFEVDFGGIPATDFTVDSSTHITATVPSGALTGPVSVFTPVDFSSSSSSFTVLPTVDSYAPTSGPVGTAVTITGTSLGVVTGVDFNGVPADFTPDSDTQITATVPAGATTGPIHVTTLAGNVAATTDDFTVTAGLTGFDPAAGVAGDSVTITGSTLTNATAVKFNGVDAASFTVDSGTQITAVVPTGATTGPITVVTDDGTAVTADDFVVAPAISGLTPSSGSAGDVVTIDGSGFTSVSDVAFNGLPAADFDVVSSTQITATVPAGATTGPVTVATAAGLATSADDFTVAATITSLTPSSGPIGGSVVIAGKSLSVVSAVDFDGTPADFTIDSDSQITATVPGGAATGPVHVTTVDGDTAASPGNFTVTPGVSGFSPATGIAGNTVTITGTTFTGTNSVKFNGVEAASFTVNSDTEIVATVPSGATSGPIMVTSPAGSGTSADDFLVAGAIVSLTPSSGTGGDLITIDGSGFTGVTDVAFNGISAAYTVVSPTQITATVPNDASTGPVTVTTAAGVATSAGDFTVGAAITGFTPGSGPAGSTVTITGTNLGAVVDVQFDGVSAVFGVDSATQVTATVPDAATSGPITIVTLSAGTATSADDFTVTPSVFGFSPLSGPVGTSVTVTGTGLSDTTAVKFNGVSASFGSPTANSVTATVPAGATTGPITVESGGASDVSSDSFTVTPTPAPTISSFTPTSGPVASGVTITGTNLNGATDVSFNGTPALAFSVDSATQISATVPAGATSGTISVTTPGGTVASADPFAVTPAVTGFLPVSGPEGTVVTITGTSFTGATSVTFGGVPATVFTVDGDGQIMATVPVGAATGQVAVTTPSGTGTSSGSFTVE